MNVNKAAMLAVLFIVLYFAQLPRNSQVHCDRGVTNTSRPHDTTKASACRPEDVRRIRFIVLAKHRNTMFLLNNLHNSAIHAIVLRMDSLLRPPSSLSLSWRQPDREAIESIYEGKQGDAQLSPGFMLFAARDLGGYGSDIQRARGIDRKRLCAPRSVLRTMGRLNWLAPTLPILDFELLTRRVQGSVTARFNQAARPRRLIAMVRARPLATICIARRILPTPASCDA